MELYIAIATFCLVTTITPGPNNIMLMTSGLNYGVRKTLPHLFGILVGFPAMVAAIGLGLGTLFLQYPVVHQTVRTVGVAYLLFLAWKIANASNPDASDKLKKPLTFFQAVAFQWVNPKAWAITIGALATFTTVGNVTSGVLAIILGYATVGSLCMVFWLCVGSGLQNLIRDNRYLRYFNITMGVLLSASVVSMALQDFGT
jgi:threonine/homoserine/homoserine lactone efflux protein